MSNGKTVPDKKAKVKTKKSARSHEDILDYWTKGRMETAKPRPLDIEGAAPVKKDLNDDG